MKKRRVKRTGMIAVLAWQRQCRTFRVAVTSIAAAIKAGLIVVISTAVTM